MSERDLMKLFESFDSEVSLSDFTVEELEELTGWAASEPEKFKEKYFAKYDDVKSSSLKKQDW